MTEVSIHAPARGATKELSAPPITLPESQLFQSGQQMAHTLSDLLFPKDAIRITPLVLFRKLPTS